MNRRSFLAASLISAGVCRSLRAAPGLDGRLIAAPQNPAAWSDFRDALDRWRAERRAQLSYDDVLYRRADMQWVSSCYCCYFLMLCDERFYDYRTSVYRVEELVDAGVRDFGGYDAIVLWHAYPRIGFDSRNQFDFYRDMPGGLPVLQRVTRRFRSRGVRVFIDYNPWDTGTRREDVSDIEAVARIVEAIEADGIFLDTMSKGAREFRARLDAARPGVVLESEGALPLENVYDHHMSWAQGFQDSAAPGILRNKWFERRHMQHQIKRWDRDHTSELHSAWMNGSGMMVWENVFGSWAGWCERDRSILRSMLPIQRRHTALFSGEGWTPLVATKAPGVYASLWEADGTRLWTLVNRSETPATGDLIEVEHRPDARYYDLIAGKEIAPSGPGAIRPRGIGAFLSLSKPDAGLSDFLERQRALDARAVWSAEVPSLRTARKAVPNVRADTIPENMAAVPAASFRMKVEFQVRECGFYESRSDMLGSTKLHQPVVFERDVSLKPYAIGLTPVTNAQFARFLESARYEPRHKENFLRHWIDGAPPSGKEDHPVVYVDLDDARAYARWASKRLPSEEEWQYAAQGPDGLRYPWGNEMKEGVCNAGGDTTSVTAFPDGRSPFGCYDMCGNTWEWTESEHSDGRTRFCILRGGSHYAAKGSQWYADGGPKPANFAAKFLLMWPGLDRCATIGFRCAVSL